MLISFERRTKEIPVARATLSTSVLPGGREALPVSIVDGVDNAFPTALGKRRGTEIFQKIQRSFTYSIDQNTSRSGVDLDGADAVTAPISFHELAQPCIAEKDAAR